MDIESLTRTVTEFRTALKGLAESGYWFPISISIKKDFPNGCCDDSSMLLAAYLEDNGFEGARRISGHNGGKNKELISHVWLKLEDLLIDITGSQFENYSQPEILIAREDYLLSTFSTEANPRIADFRRVSSLSGLGFSGVYRDIVVRIPDHP